MGEGRRELFISSHQSFTVTCLRTRLSLPISIIALSLPMFLQQPCPLSPAEAPETLHFLYGQVEEFIPSKPVQEGTTPRGAPVRVMVLSRPDTSIRRQRGQHGNSLSLAHNHHGAKQHNRLGGTREEGD